MKNKFSLGAVALALTTLMASPSFAQGDSGGSTSSEVPAFTAQSGWWTGVDSPDSPGFVVEATSTGEIYGAVLTFENTEPVWYVVKTALIGGMQQGTLQKFVGGQTLTGDFRDHTFQDFVGGAAFSFASPGAGTLALPAGNIRISRLDLVPNGAANGPAAGAPSGGWWYNASEIGTGYFLEAQGDTMFFAALMYNDLGQPTWYVARGPMVNPSFFSGDLIQYFGGGATPPSMTIGGMSILFSSDTQAMLTLPGGRQIAITRFRI